MLLAVRQEFYFYRYDGSLTGAGRFFRDIAEILPPRPEIVLQRDIKGECPVSTAVPVPIGMPAVRTMMIHVVRSE